MAFLFRRRTFFLLAGAAALVIWSAPKPWLFVAGCLVALAGEGIRIWAAGTIHKAQEVTSSGPYALVRHPLYVGSFLIAIGYFLMSGRWQAFAVGVPLFLVLHWAAVMIEERMLLALFGDEYTVYSRAVPRLFPRWRSIPSQPRMKREGPGFSWSRALYNREPFNIACVLIISSLMAARLLG